MKNIPKICHLYWDGAPMSWLHLLTVVSFHRYNPDWKIIVYLTKQHYTEFGRSDIIADYTGPDYFEALLQLDYIEFKYIDVTEYDVPLEVCSGSGSDNFRRSILYKEGGVYSDFDTIWLRPIEHIKNIGVVYGDPNDFESLVCFYRDTDRHHNVSNLISEANSPYIYSLINISKKIKPPYEYEAFGSGMLTRAYPTLATITCKFPRVLAIRYKTFYPYSIIRMPLLYLQNDINPILNNNVLCLHWFSGQKLSKEYINKQRYHEVCSMTSILKYEHYIT